eukprot:TRINITY_DN17984_c0_g1_i1.p1 TRINITY_DN17984_c0_g1~~TRINITY_DN17984_c0_g1_i1.p1  ORF type:complete len:572 (-),score=233.17 TRINITY_DN17984_c0_g1_i1:52-1767(-)
MAEYVEQRMEEMLGEVEQMERVNLLDNREVKELLKKRKHFEYKIQKRTKTREDFLSYIQYEVNLLSLLDIRRENTGYHHKKAEIEGGIRTRVNKLYKILEHRFQSDVNIWLSHIQFLKTVKWDSSVSRIYLRLLQVHNDKPRLWVAAAKWEFEHVGNPDNGRQIMLRGLRFLPTSWVLHREYLKLELLYVEQLRKRGEVLGVEKTKEKTKEELEESVLDCAIVRLVAKAAVDAVNSAKFVVSLITTVRLFPFAMFVSKELMETLVEKFPTSPVTWDTLAREELGVEGKGGIRGCVEKYYEGLEVCKTKEMFGMAFSTLTDLAEVFPNSIVRIVKNIIKLLEFGKKEDLLEVKHYKFWLELQDPETHKKGMVELVKHSLTQYPTSVDLWIEQLVLSLKTGGPKAASSSFTRGLTAVGARSSDSCRLWQVMLSTSSPEVGWQLLSGPDSPLDSNNPQLRLLHMEQAGYRGITIAREVYVGYKDLPPFNKDLHYKMLEMEREEELVSISHQRQVLTLLCDQFGSQDIGCWLEAAKLEVETGHPLEGAKLLARGEGSVGQEMREKFAVLREQMGV